MMSRLSCDLLQNNAMRIWSLHPSYLDSKGLVAVRRDPLLAQNVLLGKTKGYQNHPQLVRFKETNDPSAAIACYLTAIAEEASQRNYAFNKAKIQPYEFSHKITVTQGQVNYEFQRLLAKLSLRAPALYQQLIKVNSIRLHPLFSLIEGDVESWEVVKKQS